MIRQYLLESLAIALAGAALGCGGLVAVLTRTRIGLFTLADAIEKAPENSIFFLSQGRVQRLGFNDIYQLDSEASLTANHGKGNLVLNYQGMGPFARKILNIEEKRPRLAVATRWQRKGLGSGLLKDAMLRTLRAADIAGIQAITSGMEFANSRARLTREWKEIVRCMS